MPARKLRLAKKVQILQARADSLKVCARNMLEDYPGTARSLRTEAYTIIECIAILTDDNEAREVADIYQVKLPGENI